MIIKKKKKNNNSVMREKLILIYNLNLKKRKEKGVIYEI